MESKKTKIEEDIILKIKKLRTEKNISQATLGSILGISNGLVGNIESFRYQHKYTLKQLYTFCTYIDYPFEKLFLTDEELNSANFINTLIEKIINYDE